MRLAQKRKLHEVYGVLRIKLTKTRRGETHVSVKLQDYIFLDGNCWSKPVSSVRIEFFLQIPFSFSSRTVRVFWKVYFLCCIDNNCGSCCHDNTCNLLNCSCNFESSLIFKCRGVVCVKVTLNWAKNGIRKLLNQWFTNRLWQITFNVAARTYETFYNPIKNLMKDPLFFIILDKTYFSLPIVWRNVAIHKGW